MPVKSNSGLSGPVPSQHGRTKTRRHVAVAHSAGFSASIKVSTRLRLCGSLASSRPASSFLVFLRLTRCHCGLLPAFRRHRLNASVGKENCVKLDGRSQRLLKNGKSPAKAPLSFKSSSPTMGQKRRRSETTPSSTTLKFAPTTTTSQDTDAADVAATGTNFRPADSRSSPIMRNSTNNHFFNHMEEERRRRCSDPVAGFLHRQSIDDEGDHPLQAWDQWHLSSSSAAARGGGTTTSQNIMRPKPIRPTALLP